MFGGEMLVRSSCAALLILGHFSFTKTWALIIWSLFEESRTLYGTVWAPLDKKVFSACWKLDHLGWMCWRLKAVHRTSSVLFLMLVHRFIRWQKSVHVQYVSYCCLSGYLRCLYSKWMDRRKEEEEGCMLLNPLHPTLYHHRLSLGILFFF